MTESKEFRIVTWIVLGVIIFGSVLIEFIGLLYHHDSLVKPALIPLLILPPLAALAFAVYLLAGRPRS